MSAGLEFCERNRIWLDLRTRCAIRWLERHGFVFMVDFGYANAIEKKHLEQFVMICGAKR